MGESLKTCTKCLETKNRDLFSNHKRSKDGKKASCKSCQKLYNDKWYVNNTEKKADTSRWWNIENKYGLSKEDYLSILNSQGNCCKICKLSSEKNLHKYLYVDHCHTSLKVRGLLCKSCNSLLGMANDNIEILTNAINYLKETNETFDRI
jgi:hypothetical protein